jgi:hypothetical protein
MRVFLISPNERASFWKKYYKVKDGVELQFKQVID